MLKIRFQRIGRVNDPSFRLVVLEHTASPKAGKNVAVVGSHNPKTKHTVIDAEAVKGWLGKGAQATGTVHNLLITKGIIEGKKINVLQKRNIKKEGGDAGAATVVATTVADSGSKQEAKEEPVEQPETSSESGTDAASADAGASGGDGGASS